ncbi:hypothetical protein [Piscirickettsia litoralis]|uniref:hypothetical protein n=1 Tax=Piscirickettsia litoralis TaxID=1891921 RepID=UPI001F3195CD|nr:hypothetical protein [Piscirickettsia litoralis]
MAHYFISKLCSYCLAYRNTSHAYSNLENNQAMRSTMDTIKLVLTGLRLQFYGIVENTHGIHSIPILANQGYFEQIMSEAEIMRWIFHREQYNPAATLPDINILQFILNCWKARLTLDQNITLEQLIAEIASSYFNEQNILDKLAPVLLTGCTYQLSLNTDDYSLFKHYFNQYCQYDSNAKLKPLTSNIPINKAEHEQLLIKLYNHYLQSITDSIIPKQAKTKVAETTENI